MVWRARHPFQRVRDTYEDYHRLSGGLLPKTPRHLAAQNAMINQRKRIKARVNWRKAMGLLKYGERSVYSKGYRVGLRLAQQRRVQRVQRRKINFWNPANRKGWAGYLARKYPMGTAFNRGRIRYGQYKR